ncbi:epithelial membrane protein [Culex quinquefasciatus]|uniref:Epithelial membrane protein n=1 Tax=Culex quinquefasciatus TaxID=7176 RepID=B0X8Z5_CULQU|nr:epithelial membrane protein [Culex quinquefasciatus]|eukprot:XP_001866117.1 epithelial membrane protein [Culex quinquefasciatus]
MYEVAKLMSQQTISTQSNYLGYFLTKTISLVLTATKYKPFISLTADELVFGYDDTLVSLAHRFYPRNRRPMSQMGLLNGCYCALMECVIMALNRAIAFYCTEVVRKDCDLDRRIDLIKYLAILTTMAAVHCRPLPSPPRTRDKDRGFGRREVLMLHFFQSIKGKSPRYPQRNGTLTEYATMHTGHTGMEKFGYFDKLNGLDHMPQWEKEPCSSIEASEGSFFPPREVTNSDVVYIYDKDLCRSLPLVYRHPVEKDGIGADLYTLAEDAYGPPNENNSCYDHPDYKKYQGLQNISPCQYGAPVYISNPHFFQSDPQLLDAVEGLKPEKDIHQTFFKIQPKLGVPLEGQVRVQLNLLVEESSNVMATKHFRNFVFPIMWLEEGVSELTPPIRRWIYLATVFAPTALPIVSYGAILTGTFALIYVFVRAYKNFVFTSDPATEFLEMGRRSIRRGSSMIINGQHRILLQRDSYILLNNNNVNGLHNNNLHNQEQHHHRNKDQSLLSEDDSPA